MYKGGITIETTEIKEILWNNYKQLYAKKKKIGTSTRNGQIPGHTQFLSHEEIINLTRPIIKRD